MGEKPDQDVDLSQVVLLITSLAEEQARLRAELARARQRVETLQAELDGRPVANGSTRIDRLPVLCRDLARWSAPYRSATAAVAVRGTQPLPPSDDDLDAMTRLVESLRRLLHTPLKPGVPYHAVFDPARYQSLLAKHREVALLAERLFGQVERSRSQKDIHWHLTMARRIDEDNRKHR